MIVLLPLQSSLGGIKFVNNQLNFRLYYSNNSKTIVISANKAPVVTSDSRTKMLARAWYVTKEFNGAEMFGPKSGDNLDSSGQNIYFNVDSVGFIFTNSGTYIIQEISF